MIFVPDYLVRKSLKYSVLTIVFNSCLALKMMQLLFYTTTLILVTG